MAPPRPGRRGRDSPAAPRRGDHPPAGRRQRQGHGTPWSPSPTRKSPSSPGR